MWLPAWSLIAVALTLVGTLRANAQDWSDRQCADAYGGASTQARMCLESLRASKLEEWKRRKSYELISDYCFDVGGAANRDFAEKYPNAPAGERRRAYEEAIANCAKEQTAVFEKLLDEYIKTYLPETLRGSDCIKTFQARQIEIASHCTRSNLRALYCSSEKSVHAVCDCKLYAKARCAVPSSIQPVNFSNIGCQHIVDAAKACESACGAVSDPAACRRACDEERNQQMSICFPPAVISTDKKTPTKNTAKPTATSAGVPREDQGARATTSTAKSTGIRNSLDKHDLGASFVGANAPGSAKVRPSASGGAGAMTGTGAKTWSPSGVKQ